MDQAGRPFTRIDRTSALVARPRSRSSEQILQTLAGPTVGVLLSTVAPSVAAWASVAAALIGALIGPRDSALRQLVQMESKLDLLLRQQFIGPLRQAEYQLVDAGKAHRKPADRQRMLEDARRNLIQALSLAPDRLAEAQVHWCLAVVWLASRSLPDALSELGSGSRKALAELTLALARTRNPSPNEVALRAAGLMSTWDRVTHELGVGSGEPAVRARQELQGLAFDRLTAAEAMLDDIQRARAALGVPPGQCLAPRVWTTPAVLRSRYSPALVVRGVDGLNVLGPLSVTLHQTVSWADRRNRLFNVLDIDVAVAARSGGANLIVGFQPLHRVHIDGTNLVGPAILDVPRSAIQNPLPGPAIVGGGSPSAANNRLRLAPGVPRRGWLRLNCPYAGAGTPHATAHAAGTDFVGLRVAFGPQARGPVSAERAVFAGPWTVDLLLPLPDAPRRLDPPKRPKSVSVKPLVKQTRPRPA